MIIYFYESKQIRRYHNRRRCGWIVSCDAVADEAFGCDNREQRPRGEKAACHGQREVQSYKSRYEYRALQ